MNEYNFIVLNGHEKPGDDKLFFGDEDVTYTGSDVDMIDIIVRCELFPSKSQARKNWKHGEKIPPGFTDFQKLGKMNKRITILNPIAED